MSLRRLLALIAVLGMLVHAAAIAGHTSITLAGPLQAGERAALAAVGVSLPMARATSQPTMLVCPDFVAKAVVAVLLERVAFRDMRLGKTNYFRERARTPLRLSACS